MLCTVPDQEEVSLVCLASVQKFSLSCLPVPNATETRSEQASVTHSLRPNSEVLLVEMEASARLVAHLVGQSL